MLSKEQIQTLLENPEVLYMYELGSSLYSVHGGTSEYLIIVTDKYNPLISESNLTCILISKWFDLVQACDLLPWQCACLPKNRVKKEAVKLLMSTNPVELYKAVISAKNAISVDDWSSVERVVITATFARQIMDNHKIVNFKEPSKYLIEKPEEITMDIINAYLDPILSPVIAIGKPQYDSYIKKKVYERNNKNGTSDDSKKSSKRSKKNSGKETTTEGAEQVMMGESSTSGTLSD